MPDFMIAVKGGTYGFLFRDCGMVAKRVIPNSCLCNQVRPLRLDALGNHAASLGLVIHNQNVFPMYHWMEGLRAKTPARIAPRRSLRLGGDQYESSSRRSIGYPVVPIRQPVPPVIEGESFRGPKRMPENCEERRCKIQKKAEFLMPFESAFGATSDRGIVAIIPGTFTPIRDNPFLTQTST
ncbi:hypothetical protein [Paraburkholderia fungorum]|uniref:hypothetical protein n=2 Tax=Paraburkholderia fungorum TaxID=134537 RepID=UPI00402B3288